MTMPLIVIDLLQEQKEYEDMKSVTKTSLDNNMVETLSEKHFPGSKLQEITELKGGMFNSAYLIKGTGFVREGIVLKVGAASETEVLTYEKDLIETEAEVYGMLADKEIPTPAILAVDFSREIVDSSCIFMEHIPGQAWNKVRRKISKENHRELMEKFGGYNAAVHSVKGTWFGYIKNDERYRFNTWADAFNGMMRDILHDGKVRNCKLPYGRIEEVLKKYEGILNEVKEPSLVDFDMWPGNVLVKETGSGYDFRGVIDFERAFYGDPYADFTSAVTLFDDVESEPEFIMGYEKKSGRKLVITENDRIRMNLYRLYMAVIMHVETYRYQKLYSKMIKHYTTGNINKLIKKL